MTFINVEESWIETFTGRKFHFKDSIDPLEIDIQDVAHALSMQCRYNGHTKVFYSVSEHSVHIARYLKALGYDDQTALTGLFHEVAETYIGDMVRPVKYLPSMNGFRMMEKKIDIAAAIRFGMIWPFPPIIKELDTRILVDEREQVMLPSLSFNEWSTDGIEPLGVTIAGWRPARAELEFISAVREFAPDDNDFFNGA